MATFFVCIQFAVYCQICYAFSRSFFAKQIQNLLHSPALNQAFSLSISLWIKEKVTGLNISVLLENSFYLELSIICCLFNSNHFIYWSNYSSNILNWPEQILIELDANYSLGKKELRLIQIRYDNFVFDGA